MTIKDELQAKIEEIKTAIDAIEDKAEAEAQEVLNQLKEQLTDLKDALDTAEDKFVEDLKAQIDEVEEKFNEVKTEIENRIDEFEEDVDEFIDDQEWIPEDTQSWLMANKWYVIGGLVAVIVLGLVILAL